MMFSLFVSVLLFFNGVVTQDHHFLRGDTFVKNTKLCDPWNCLYQSLGLATPPTKDEFRSILKSRNNQDWQEAVETALNVCYGKDLPRSYTDTCPGQAKLHCIVDELNNACPKGYYNESDACAPVMSLAGFKYMFSQSRFKEMQIHIDTEQRSKSFLNNYFSRKCCKFPELFDQETIEKCGFNRMVHFYDHEPKKAPFLRPNINNYNPVKRSTTTESVKVVDEEQTNYYEDPLDCCDITNFIPQNIRSECGFQTMLDESSHLRVVEKQIKTETEPVTTERVDTRSYYDVKIVPVPCPLTTVVFTKLEVINDNQIDIESFGKLLANLTKHHPEWKSAEARVVTKCLSKPLEGFDGECEINQLLSCTFDVLSENCPNRNSSDPCRHQHGRRDNATICQVSSSVNRAKARRQFCPLPSLVPDVVLTELRIRSISNVVPVRGPPEIKPRKYAKWTDSKTVCKEAQTPTKCLLDRAQLLNKYKFIDYFGMRNRIRNFTSTNADWSMFTDVFIGAFASSPLYYEYCTTQRKFFNVLDAMLTVCPKQRRRNTETCNKVFENLAMKNSREKVDQIYKQMFENLQKKHAETTTEYNLNENYYKNIETLFHPNRMPPAQIIPIKPQVIARYNRAPIIRNPVYMNYVTSPSTTIEPKIQFVPYLPPYENPSLRSEFERPFTNAHSGDPIDL